MTRYPKSKRHAVFTMIRARIPLTQIEREQGVNRTTIYRWLRGRKLPNYTHTPNIPELSEVERGYVAGIIDGEGTVSIYQDKNRWGKNKDNRIFPEIFVSNGNQELINLFVDKYGFERRGQNGNKTGNRRPVYRVSIRRQIDVETLLNQIQHFLVVKREQAKILRAFIQLRKNKLAHGVKTKDYGEEETQLIREIRVLNKRGK